MGMQWRFCDDSMFDSWANREEWEIGKAINTKSSDLGVYLEDHPS